jgi:hypothetical protein
MQQLTGILQDATRAISDVYFRLPIDGGDPTYRERVYCYELYHQMRRLWPDTHYALSGEVDKQGHQVMMQLGVRAAAPDLLVHGPGRMQDNHCVIEVKPPRPTIRGMRKDLLTLSQFRALANYERAIYLFYANYPQRIVRRLVDELDGCPRIEVWLHPEVGQPAEQVDELER